MFDKKVNENEIETIIGPSVKVEGVFIGKGNVHIEGKMSGKLDTVGNVIVGEQAKIIADVSAHAIIVSGEIKGNVIAEDKLHLTNSAKVTGNIRAKMLIIDQGAIFEGKSSMHILPEGEQNSKMKQQTPLKK